jgi:hypothetical protein
MFLYGDFPWTAEIIWIVNSVDNASQIIKVVRQIYVTLGFFAFPGYLLIIKKLRIY